jgi:thymidylate synthase (FAD)
MSTFTPNEIPEIPHSVKGWRWTRRMTVDTAEAIVGASRPVLDKGFVQLIDYMGGDDRIVEAARVSYGGGTTATRPPEGLIRYLMRNKHTSPFEQVVMTFRIKLPLFVFAQLVRHRMARLNSLSARYSVMEDEFYIPELDDVRGQSAVNKQVGDGDLPMATREEALSVFKAVCGIGYGSYNTLLGDPVDPEKPEGPRDGVAREQARMVLPQNLYTMIYWQIDLHNLAHFLRLRLDWHAQKEIRVYAEAMYEAAKAVAPLAMKAADDWVIGAKTVSKTGYEVLKALVQTHVLADRLQAAAEAIENPTERAEFVAMFSAQGAQEGAR